jgi:hypothetical protein
MIARIAGRYRAVNAAEPIRRGRRPPRTVDRSGACRRPVNEKKKILGRFYLIECDTNEEVVEWAKKIIPTEAPA